MTWQATNTFVVGQVLTSTAMNLISGDLTAASAVGSYQYVCAIAGTAATETLWQGAWLEANGAAVSRTTYAALFNYLNGLSTPLPFGTGNGSTTFNLPDISGRDVIAMAPTTGNTTVKTLGNNDGVAIANRRGALHRHTAHNHGLTVYSSNSGSSAGHDGLATSSAPGVTGGPNVYNTLSDTTRIAATDGGSGTSTDPLDGGAYIVAGVWVIKALA